MIENISDSENNSTILTDRLMASIFADYLK